MRLVFQALMLFLVSCTNSTTAIEGDDNDNNKVVVGNNNIITFNGKDYNRPINKDLGVNISVNNEVTAFVRGALELEFEGRNIEDFSRIKYKAEQKGGAVILYPDVDFIKLLKEGEPVSNMFIDLDLNGSVWGDDPNTILTFPNLDFKIVNNSQNTVFFNKVVFDIRGSREVKEPLIVPVRTMDEKSVAVFDLYNEGWSDVGLCEVFYNIYPPQTKNFDYSNTPFSKNVTAEINKHRKSVVSIEAALQSLGVNTILMKEHQWEPTKLKTILGKFFSLSEDQMLNPLMVAGRIKYTWLNENNVSQTKEVKFYVPIELEGGYGAPSPVTDHFNAKFETNKQKYTVEVPISNTLKPTETDRINIMIAADKTSVHDFSAKLYYNDTSFYETGPIQINYFLPYSAQGLYKEALKSLKKKTLHK